MKCKKSHNIQPISSKKNQAYDQVSSIKYRGDNKKLYKSLGYKSVSYHRRKLKFRFVIKRALYKCGDRIWNNPGSAIRDYYAEYLPKILGRCYRKKYYDSLHYKTKG